MAKRRAEGNGLPEVAASPLSLEALFSRTGPSPLLVCGRVARRMKLEGVSERGPWQTLRAEIVGADGRSVTVTVPDLSSIPEKGELICLPVYLANGFLREARPHGEEV